MREGTRAPEHARWAHASLVFVRRYSRERIDAEDLEPILDAIRKDRASLSSNVDVLIRWARGQEAKVATAVSDAREVALRQIRDAPANYSRSA
jgi:hypothetical protein